ncbi:hypothetical protein CYY_004471 [Polysphondylium violaceum]|uniref:Uncharacterized protein n=1 Tax=Polysphondylium violaceum TaxID=133409 RepID=A0A8J4PW63_9MYCE|nr:hypothetical protein CYY_004471 [Polysphondylium violaceum]
MLTTKDLLDMVLGIPYHPNMTGIVIGISFVIMFPLFLRVFGFKSEGITRGSGAAKAMSRLPRPVVSKAQSVGAIGIIKSPGGILVIICGLALGYGTKVLIETLFKQDI